MADCLDCLDWAHASCKEMSRSTVLPGRRRSTFGGPQCVGNLYIVAIPRVPLKPRWAPFPSHVQQFHAPPTHPPIPSAHPGHHGRAAHAHWDRRHRGQRRPRHHRPKRPVGAKVERHRPGRWLRQRNAPSATRRSAPRCIPKLLAPTGNLGCLWPWRWRVLAFSEFNLENGLSWGYLKLWSPIC